jgi:hypothetical protein
MEREVDFWYHFIHVYVSLLYCELVDEFATNIISLEANQPLHRLFPFH